VTQLSSSERHPADIPPVPLRGASTFPSIATFRDAYLLLLPAVLIYAVFTIYPIYRQFDISFYDWHISPAPAIPSSAGRTTRRFFTIR